VYAGAVLHLAISVSLAIVDPEPVGLGAPALRAATLLAESPPPLSIPDEPTLSTSASTEAELEALNKRIRAMDVHWPTGAVIAGYAGGLLLYVTFVVGLTALAVGGTSAIPAAVVIGMGIAGAGLIVVAWVTGSTAAAGAREQREELIKERDLLQKRLRDQGEAVPFVEQRLPAITPLVTLAQF